MSFTRYTSDNLGAAEEKFFSHDAEAHVHFRKEQGPAFSLDNNAGFSLPSIEVRKFCMLHMSILVSKFCLIYLGNLYADCRATG